jgi:hypothetical protein
VPALSWAETPALQPAGKSRPADRDPAFSSSIRDGLPRMPRQGLDPFIKALNLLRQKMQKEIKRIPHLVGMPDLEVTP